MQVTETPIPGVLQIEPTVFSDPRGFFVESWNARRYGEHGIVAEFTQDNHSRSVRGTLRGLHYQAGEHAQGKLVRASRGEVFDVVVDLRRASPTFGRWHGVLLSEENHRQLWVPPGLAHGFLVLSDSADFQYKCTGAWTPSAERTLAWDDRTVAVGWPETGVAPILSEKDRTRGLSFSECETFA